MRGGQEGAVGAQSCNRVKQPVALDSAMARKEERREGGWGRAFARSEGRWSIGGVRAAGCGWLRDEAWVMGVRGQRGWRMAGWGSLRARSIGSRSSSSG